MVKILQRVGLGRDPHVGEVFLQRPDNDSVEQSNDRVVKR